MAVVQTAWAIYLLFRTSATLQKHVFGPPLWGPIEKARRALNEGDVSGLTPEGRRKVLRARRWLNFITGFRDFAEEFAWNKPSEVIADLAGFGVKATLRKVGVALIPRVFAGIGTKQATQLSFDLVEIAGRASEALASIDSFADLRDVVFGEVLDQLTPFEGPLTDIAEAAMDAADPMVKGAEVILEVVEFAKNPGDRAAGQGVVEAVVNFVDAVGAWFGNLFGAVEEALPPPPPPPPVTPPPVVPPPVVPPRPFPPMAIRRDIVFRGARVLNAVSLPILGIVKEARRRAEFRGLQF